mmetsp:Transcript_97387/g.270899  ORF Transcript_97387/g.270899 Transcript_97387/m.270899 type:complete len:299 (+) Transcript_97387:114-1010(+)
MGEGCEETEPRHELLVFHCNFATKDGDPCSHPLKEGWITACSHLLCYDHAKEWFQNHDDCPICRSGKVKLVRMDLSQTSVKRRGRMSLIGMTPPEILEASETALSFWVDQKLFEFQRKGQRHCQLLGRQKSIEELIKTKLREAETTCNALEAEQRALQQQIDEKDKENRKISEEVQRLKWDLAAAEDRHSSLQKQIAGEHRQELFRRPLLEAPAPLQAAAEVGHPAARASLGHFCKPSTAPQIGASSRDSAFGDRPGAATASRPVAFCEFLGAHSSRRLPTFTPGFLGTGRVTKRRIT